MRGCKHYIVLYLLIILTNSCSDKRETTKDASVLHIEVAQIDELKKELPTLVILDVRTPPEIAQGKIENAREIDFRGNDFKKRISKLDKSKPYLVYCKSGGRSSNAAKLMVNNGFDQVYNLLGGYTAYQSTVSQQPN